MMQLADETVAASNAGVIEVIGFTWIDHRRTYFGGIQRSAVTVNSLYGCSVEYEHDQQQAYRSG